MIRFRLLAVITFTDILYNNKNVNDTSKYYVINLCGIQQKFCNHSETSCVVFSDELVY